MGSGTLGLDDLSGVGTLGLDDLDGSELGHPPAAASVVEVDLLRPLMGSRAMRKKSEEKPLRVLNTSRSDGLDKRMTEAPLLGA